jgi:hypothetical protein
MNNSPTRLVDGIYTFTNDDAIFWCSIFFDHIAEDVAQGSNGFTSINQFSNIGGDG